MTTPKPVTAKQVKTVTVEAEILYNKVMTLTAPFVDAPLDCLAGDATVAVRGHAEALVRDLHHLHDAIARAEKEGRR